jgi:hypothetical protein
MNNSLMIAYRSNRTLHYKGMSFTEDEVKRMMDTFRCLDNRPKDVAFSLDRGILFPWSDSDVKS